MVSLLTRCIAVHLVSDIAIFVLKRDVKLQLTNYCCTSLQLDHIATTTSSILRAVFQASLDLLVPLVMVAPCNRADHYIFALWFLSSFFFFFFFSPNLSSQRLDVYHTSTHGVALVRI